MSDKNKSDNGRLYCKSDVTPEDVEAVEDELGMGAGAWDMVDPASIIAAAWNLLKNKKGS